MSNLDAMMVKPVKILLGTRGLFVDLIRNRSGNAATEFAVIVPLMLAMFFGTVETSSGVAVSRKVTLVARTLSDLVSQSTSVSDTDLSNFLITGKAILTPFPTAPLNATITELYVDPTTKVPRVLWSKGSSPHAKTEAVTIPDDLKVGGTYLIWSEVNYKYEPTIGYIMAKAGIPLKDDTYTRPRQSACVIYPTPSSGVLPNCPTQ